MFPIAQIKKAARRSPCLIGAGEGIRTLDPNLGKVKFHFLLLLPPDALSLINVDI